MDLGDTPAHHARNDPDELALVFGDRRLTWEDLDGGANRIANALVELGAERGDKALLPLDNCVEFVTTYYGLAKLGCINAPVLTSLVPRKVEAIAESLDAEFVVAGADSSGFIEEIDDALEPDTRIVGVGRPGRDRPTAVLRLGHFVAAACSVRSGYGPLAPAVQ